MTFNRDVNETPTDRGASDAIDRTRVNGRRNETESPRPTSTSRLGSERRSARSCRRINRSPVAVCLHYLPQDNQCRVQPS
ncbi:hypothetical protein Hamer_G026080 [Homarus americanus]|uniref:Uncharacterized protein n=1 Tax=Homarus americanus TaxID=6706 RepID=A0A8J5JIC2_HOMAM|nr:hypothetical protein Hamer_G026080 [Homarus americanus]